MAKRNSAENFFLALVWLLSNAAFGLAPILCMILAKPAVKDPEPLKLEIHKLMEGGIILFVCCALMGSVIVDILISKIKFKRFAFFAVNISPFVLLGLICFLYIMTIFGHVEITLFTTFSRFYNFVIFFTIFYCTLGKYLLYKEENKQRIF